MSFKLKIFRWLRELFKDAGLGFALLGAGALAFQSLGDSNTLLFGILFVVMGIIFKVISLVMLLLEDLIFESQ